MTSARVPRLLPAALLALASALAVALTTPMGTDYVADAGPAIDALVRGDLRGAFAMQPQMGPLSLLVRWPFAALGGDPLWSYRLGALACLLFPAALAVALTALAPREGAPRTAVAALLRGRPAGERRSGGDAPVAVVLLVTVVLVVNPVVVRALELGHPEEPMGAALCVAAVLFALRGRPTLAGVTLGLALATKQWALLAVVPVLLAAQDRPARVRVGVLGLGLGAAFALLTLAMDPSAFFDALEKPVAGLHEMRPGNVWSLLFGASAHVDTGGGTILPVTFVPGWLRATAHPAVVVGGVVVALLWVRRRHGHRAADVLALLALIMLLRCVADPWNHEYYHLPFLAAFAAWEILAARRAPVVAALSSTVLWIVFARLAAGSGTSTAADAVYVAWALGTTGYLARVLWWPRGIARRATVVAG